MSDITMCNRDDCPNQDNCWRLNAPPDLIDQSYQLFYFDYDEFELDNNSNGCDFYIAMDELDFSLYQ